MVIPVVVVFACCLWNALAWIDRPFAGFLFLENGIVVSIGRTEWAPPQRRSAQWTRLVAVDGTPVAAAPEVQAYVNATGIGKPITYTFRQGTEMFRQAITVRAFARRDFVELFAPMLGVGLLLVLTGAAIAWLRPDAPEVRALFAVSASVGVNLITAPDAYAPYWFTALYFLSLCLVPPAIVHVALAYPRQRRLARAGPLVLAALYLPFASLTVAFLLARWDPSVFLPLLYIVYVLIANAMLLYVGGLVLAMIDGLRPLAPLVLALGAVVGTCVLVATTLVAYPLMQRPISPIWLLAPLLLNPLLTGVAFLRYPRPAPSAEEGVA